MKINLNKIDKESFMVHESTVYGEPLYLIQPQHIGCKWTQENKIFRSSIWNAEGELVSAGLPKFVNWGENPEVFPVPLHLKGAVCTEKLDGSLLIVSKYKGQLILRTRGTVNAFVHDNRKELEIFLDNMPIFPTFMSNHPTWNFSILFEWVSPTNRIILNYGDKPDFYLVGWVNHEDYSLKTQKELDGIALVQDFKRPKTYSFNSIEDLLKVVEEWKGKEGIVVYSKNDQTLHKVKSAWYLALHKMKSEISNIENLVDVYLSWGMPEYQDFEKRLIDTFDFELFQQIKDKVGQMFEAKIEADKIINHMLTFISPLKNEPRKNAALEIIKSYGQTNRKSMCFLLLDGKMLGDKEYKTLILQSL